MVGVLKKKVMVCLFQQRLQPKSLQRESCTSALSALWRSSNQLHSACRKWGEEQLWMDVDGSAKSESPVDRWWLYVFYHFYPIIWDGFQPSVWWCRISLAHPQYHCRDEIWFMMTILSGRVNHTSGTVEKKIVHLRWQDGSSFNKTPQKTCQQLTMLAPPVMAKASMNGFSESWVVYICLHIPICGTRSKYVYLPLTKVRFPSPPPSVL